MSLPARPGGASSPSLAPPATPATVGAALAQARAAGLDAFDAQILVAESLGRPRSWLLSHDGDALTPEQAAPLAQAVARCAAGVPLAYVLGHQDFRQLRLRVSPAVLIPRADTETLVDWALEALAGRPGASVIDLGTGSGAIALAIKQAQPRATVHASDASPEALALAQANAQALGLAIEWHAGDWWQAVPGRRFDLAVANPPYIAARDPHLEALSHEPRQALVAGESGLDDLQRLIDGAPEHLNPGGWLLLEHGWDQAEAVQAWMRAGGWEAVGSRRDLGGRWRCTGGRRPGGARPPTGDLPGLDV